ncbi:MAG: 3'-5' exoribonuclease [Syntrophomonadaceae bacterium]|nr:3'-5' exoribonuclease [Syntrophomonadaceae bacterium]
MRIFFDSEFTGIRQDTTLISIGLVTEDDHMFYAEFTDYDRNQVFPWLEENVLKYLWLSDPNKNVPEFTRNMNLETCLGDKETVGKALRNWISQWDKAELWADIIPFDWVLLCGLLGGVFNLPKNMEFICYDICTFLKILGFESNINREEFVGYDDPENKHNALYDALVVKAMYEKLMVVSGQNK